MMRDESRAQKISLFPNEDVTPQQVLLDALNLVGEQGLKEVMIVASDKDDNIVIRASAMKNKDALWFACSAALHAMGISRDD